jgi:hypothetical protein
VVAGSMSSPASVVIMEVVVDGGRAGLRNSAT